MNAVGCFWRETPHFKEFHEKVMEPKDTDEKSPNVTDERRNVDDAWESFRREFEEKGKRLDEIQKQLEDERRQMAALLGRIKEHMEQGHESLQSERKQWDAMADKLKQTQLPNCIKLNVGGRAFATSLTTLTSVKGTFFESMFGGRWPLTPEADGSFFIDRDPEGFSLILQCLRSEKINPEVLSPKELDAFHRDADYYGLPAPLVRRCLCTKLATQEKFSSRCSAGISVTLNDKVASRTSDYSNSSEWVLGSNVYGGQDHVLIRIRVEKCARRLVLGVLDVKTPTPGAESTFVGDGLRQTSGRSGCETSNMVFRSGDDVEVEIDCMHSKLTVRNITQNITDSTGLPSDKQWHLEVRICGKDDMVRILESTKLW